MGEIRPQYHFRQTSSGVDAWDVQRLIRLAVNLPVERIDPSQVAELDHDHWYALNDERPTPRSLLRHMRLIQDCDLRYPIILDAQGRVMDGMHRVCKALLTGQKHIDAVRFEVDPQPDFVNCDPQAVTRMLPKPPQIG